MISRLSFNRLLLAVFFLSLSVNFEERTQAQDSKPKQLSEISERHRSDIAVVSSYLNESTLMLAEIDWTKINVEESFKLSS